MTAVDPVATAARMAPSAWPAASPAQLGVNRVERADGSVETLGAHRLGGDGPGDVFVIETPGGGGYGAPCRATESRATPRHNDERPACKAAAAAADTVAAGSATA